jgi:D-tyrosyl-tRNA(Tyr) deacylase
VRAVVQRVSQARVESGGRVLGEIGPGLAVLLGVGREDGPDQARWLAGKIASLRVFDDPEGRLNRSLADSGGEVLVVSQFTLWGDCKKGTRPSFSRAAPGEAAEPLYGEFCAELERRGLSVATGEFGALMQVHLVNDGPVTLLLDTDKGF